MATNSEALGNTADEYRTARASVEKPEGGVWPVGGARNPLADQVAAGADAQDVQDEVAAGVPVEEIVADGPAPDAGEVDSAGAESAKTGVSAASRRAATASTKAGQAKS